MKWIKYYTVIVVLFTIIILEINLYSKKQILHTIKEKLTEKSKKDSITISELTNRIELLYTFQMFTIDSTTVLIKENGDSLSLNNIKFDSLLFVIRFSEFTCMSCISSEMKLVAKHLKKKSNILFLSTYKHLNDLRVNKKLLEISSPVYNVSFSTFPNKIEQKRLPYYFVLDKNYNVKHLFIADPNNHNLTSKYLKFIDSLFDSF